MSTKHYLLTAKTCSKLDQKFLVISEDEFNDLPNKEDYIIDGPKDILDALFDKAEKLEELVIPHVRWSVMRDGHEPVGTFNNFVDGEFYKIVERGSYHSYWRYRRAMLVEAAFDKIANFESVASCNELDSICNVLYTDLNKSVYKENDTPDKLNSYMEAITEVRESMSEKSSAEMIDKYSEQFDDYPTPGENSSTKNEQKEQTSSKVVEEEQTEEKTVIPVIPGVRLMKLEYDTDSSQNTRDEIGLQLHHEIYNWVKSNKEIKSLLLCKNYVDVQKSKIKITMFPKDGAPIRIIYTPALNGNSYVVDIQGMIIAIKTQVMIELGCISKVSLDSVKSYDPRKQAVDVDCDHRSIPYEAKPERDMRNNLVLDEKEFGAVEEPIINTPIANVTEDDIGVLIDRIKDNTDNIIAIATDANYITSPDLRKAIGEFNVDPETLMWLSKHAVVMAKSIKLCAEAGSIKNISFETIQYMVLRCKKLKGITKISVKNIDYDKISLIVDDLLSKEFMRKDYFKSCVDNSMDDMNGCYIALKIANLIVSNYHGADIIKEINKLNSIGLSNRDSHIYMLSLMGVPSALLDAKNNTEANRLRAIKDVFNPENDYEYDFCDFKRDNPYKDLLTKIAKHYFSEKGNISLYDLLMNQYREYLSDDLVHALALRAVATQRTRYQRNKGK